MAECRLDYQAAGAAEHMLLCKFFEILFCHDQIDGTMISAAELLARRLQTLHEKWKHKLPNLGAGTGAVGSMEDDSYLLLGISETRCNLGVCPRLQQWLGEELAREAVAAKERRKAREERALAGKK